MQAPYGKIELLGTPFRMSRTPGDVRLHPPMLGENTQEILRGLGYSKSEIEKMTMEGLINAGVSPDRKTK
jgi:Predicted acyl-CoA transferases/carnitine dehydratase